MNIKNKIIKNTSIIGISSLLLGILNFIVISVLVSDLGFKQYGLYVFILFLSVNNGFMSLFDFGLKSIVTRHISYCSAINEIKKINEFINFSLIMSFFIGLTISLLIIFNYDLIKNYFIDINNFDGFFDVFKIFIFSYVFQYLNYIFIGIYEGFQRYDISKVIAIVFYIIQSISVIFIVKLELNINYIVYAFVYTYIMNLIVNFVILKKIFKFKFSLNNINSNWFVYFDMAKHIFPTQISSIIYNQYPKFFILHFLDISYLGIYDVIVKIPRFLKTIAGFINSALMPIVSELTALKQDKKISKIYEIGFKINIIILTPIVTAVLYFAMPIFDVWINDTTNYKFMQTLLIWNLLVPYVTFGGPLLMGMNKELKFMKNVSWSITIISIITSLVLIDNMKLWGLVYGQLAGLILLPFIFYKYMKIFNVNIKNFIMTNIYIYTIAIIPVGVFHLFGIVHGISSLLLAIIIWCIIYYIAIYIFILKQIEREILKKIYYKIIARLKK